MGMIDLALAALLGLIAGSFASALSYRLPRGLPIVAARSACPHCGQGLGPLDLVPVLSWAFNRGRCRHCGAGVSWRYPLTEVASAAAFVLIAWVEADWLPAALLMVVATLLITAAVIDLEFGILPDKLHVAVAPFALAYRWLLDGTLVPALVGAVAGYAAGLALLYGFKLATGREGLGRGDVKFLAVAGLLLQPEQWVAFPLIAGVAGVTTGLLWRASGRGAEFPFGPALIGALFVCLLLPGNTLGALGE